MEAVAAGPEPVIPRATDRVRGSVYATGGVPATEVDVRAGTPRTSEMATEGTGTHAVRRWRTTDKEREVLTGMRVITRGA